MFPDVVKGKVFSIDMRERTERPLEESRAETESSRLNKARRLHLDERKRRTAWGWVCGARDGDQEKTQSVSVHV